MKPNLSIFLWLLGHFWSLLKNNFDWKLMWNSWLVDFLKSNLSTSFQFLLMFIVTVILILSGRFSMDQLPPLPSTMIFQKFDCVLLGCRFFSYVFCLGSVSFLISLVSAINLQMFLALTTANISSASSSFISGICYVYGTPFDTVLLFLYIL